MNANVAQFSKKITHFKWAYGLGPGYHPQWNVVLGHTMPVKRLATKPVRLLQLSRFVYIKISHFSYIISSSLAVHACWLPPRPTSYLDGVLTKASAEFILGYFNWWQVYRKVRLVENAVRFQCRWTHWWVALLLPKVAILLRANQLSQLLCQSFQFFIII